MRLGWCYAGLLACVPPDDGDIGGGSTTTTAVTTSGPTATSDPTSVSATEESSTGFQAPAGCAVEDIGPCAGIALPEGMMLSTLSGWSRTDETTRTVVAADPPIACPFESPEECDACGHFFMTKLVIPNSIAEPGMYFIAENGIEVECTGYQSSCPGFTEEGPAGCEYEEDCGPNELEVIAIEEECVVIVEPCGNPREGGVIRAPRCGR